MHELWVEKYRPNTLDDYVWRDAKQRAEVEKWIAAGAVPHLLLSGVQGSGKTSLALMVLKQLKVQSGDILEINASRERNPDVVATKILNFCTTWALGGMKYVLLDEADSMTPLAQRILRGEMEKYHENVRFILTCNYPQKIIPALHSRCQGFHFTELNLDEFTARVANILIAEGVKIETEEDIQVIDSYVEATHPDLRKCINMVQQNVVGDKLAPLAANNTASKDYLTEMVNLFKNGKHLEARKLIVSQAQLEEYDEIFRFFYQNLDLWGASEDQQNEALIVIRKGMVNDTLCADREINLAATIAELTMVSKQ